MSKQLKEDRLPDALFKTRLNYLIYETYHSNVFYRYLCLIGSVLILLLIRCIYQNASEGTILLLSFFVTTFFFSLSLYLLCPLNQQLNFQKTKPFREYFAKKLLGIDQTNMVILGTLLLSI